MNVVALNRPIWMICTMNVMYGLGTALSLFNIRLCFELYKIFISAFMFILSDDAQVINPMFYVMRPLVACYWPVMHPNPHRPGYGA